MYRLWCVVLTLAVACGDNGDTAVDAGVDVDPFGTPSDTYPAFQPPLPTITKDPTGSVIASPRVVQVYFANDPDAATLSDFVTKLAASSYWAPMVAEYGVGALTVATPVMLATDAPTSATDAEIASFLAAQLDGSHVEWGAVDPTTVASTIYLLHYPLGSTVTGNTPDHPMSCTQMGGYHASTPLPGATGTNITYAVTISCPTWPPFLYGELDAVTAGIGHELVEAVTDPKPFDGYAHIGVPDLPWAMEYGGELADLCEMTGTSWWKPGELGYTIQRSWSNESAHAYHNPCVPIPPADKPFFAAAPVQFDTVMIGTGKVRGTKVQVGVPRTIDVQLFSDGPTSGTWTVEGIDTATVRGTPAVLDLTFDRDYGQNGNTVHMTILAKSRPDTGYMTYRLKSSLGSTFTVWWGLVGIDP